MKRASTIFVRQSFDEVIGISKRDKVLTDFERQSDIERGGFSRLWLCRSLFDSSTPLFPKFKIVSLNSFSLNLEFP